MVSGHNKQTMSETFNIILIWSSISLLAYILEGILAYKEYGYFNRWHMFHPIVISFVCIPVINLALLITNILFLTNIIRLVGEDKYLK